MSGVRIDLSDIFNKIEKMEDKWAKAYEIYADSAGKKMEQYAKENAPWTDRTAKARGTIIGGGQWVGENKIRAYVSGNVEYFIYLELANQKKYAILNPTLNKMSDEIVKGMKNLLEH